MDHIQQFAEAIRSFGLQAPDKIIDDGAIHRFSTNGKAGDKSGWYVLHGDGIPAGQFGCFRSGMDSTFRVDIGRKLTAREAQEQQARLEEAKRKRDAELAAEREHAKRVALEMWSRAEKPNGHAYLEKKGVEPLGVRELDDIILVPVYDKAKQLVGLQRIYKDGQKFFLRGTPAAGGYMSIGKDPTRIAICEGWATGVSIHEATQRTVVVAFNAGNLPAVAKIMRQRYPDADIVIAADNDQFTDGNPGLSAAEAAGRAIGASVIVPQFHDLSTRPTDFNDMHILDGIEAVREAFNPRPVAASAPRVVDYITWLADVNDKGRPLSTIQNVVDICERLGIIIRYNVISKEEEILIPGAEFSLDNRQNASLAYLLSECAKFRMPLGNIPEYVTFIADQNLFNPVANWISSRPWDGEDRLSQLIGTVIAAGEMHSPRVSEMKRALITRWMVSAVAAAFRPNGVSAHGVLVFQGDQYIGKTKWFKTLVPASLGVLQDGVILRPEDRDSVKQCVANWLVELGELDATFRKSDIAALKAFLTKDRDVLRRAYARRESEFARRTVFFASVNPKEFLHDPTGNRRYWTIECERLDYDHDIDMQQCWAQVYEQFYQAGESWFLSPEEMDALNDHNKGFEVIDPIEELISNNLYWDSDTSGWNWRSATDVLRDLGRDTPTQAEATRAAHIIRSKNGRLSKKTNGTRTLLVPDVKRPYRP